MKEGVRFNRIHTGFAALAALFVFGGDASAQDTRSYVERQGFREFQDTGSGRLAVSPTPNSSFTVDTSAPTLNLGEIARLQDRPREDELTDVEDVIVVTAERTENFSMGDTSEFDETIFDQVVSTSNPDLAGLAFLTPEERRDNGWAVSVPALGGRPGETGPFVSFEAGRGRLISGGIRF